MDTRIEFGTILHAPSAGLDANLPLQSISNFIIARKLREKYGWPDSFEAAEWAEDWERALQEAYNEEDRVTDGLRGEDWEEATQRWCQAQSASSLGDGQ